MAPQTRSATSSARVSKTQHTPTASRASRDMKRQPKSTASSSRPLSTASSHQSTTSIPSGAKPANPDPDASATASTTAPIFFWKPDDPATGFLSQWHPSPFTDSCAPDIAYPTAEHYMMYQKALLFHDGPIAANILVAQTPREVKTLGRAVQGFDEVVWAANRERIVRDGSRLKFGGGSSSSSGNSTQGAAADDLRAWLLGTGDAELVEASPFDRIWGIGFTPKAAPRSDRGKWGYNLLGKALMVVRDELRAESQTEQLATPGIDPPSAS